MPPCLPTPQQAVPAGNLCLVNPGEMGISAATHKQRGLYVGLLLLLAKHGFRKRRSETPREFAERVASTGDVHQPLIDLTNLYYHFRFGMSSDAEKQFRQSLSTYEGALRSLSPQS